MRAAPSQTAPSPHAAAASASASACRRRRLWHGLVRLTAPAALLLPLLMILPLLAACGPAGGDAAAPDAAAPPADHRIQVVATIGMVADLAREIGGDRVEVTTLVGPGIDPHSHRPSREDVRRLMEADLVLANGLGLEGRMLDALDRAAAAGIRMRRVAEGIDASELLPAADFEGVHDPHAWMDPGVWRLAAGIVHEELRTIDPEGAEAYDAGAAALAADLEALAAYADRVLASVPPEHRVLVTAHDAFGYLGRRHGYEVLGIQGISTESEAGVRDIERLVDLLVERRVPAVFVESTVSDRNIRALLAGAAARGHEVRIGGSLFSDAMGEPGTWEGTYRGMIDHNVTAIARALGGTPPAGGMLGRLAE